jgi:hypothetical protein
MTDEDKPICEYFRNACYFEKPCSELNETNNHFHIKVSDDTQELDFDIEEKNLRVEATQMGVTGPLSRRCYIPIFRHKLSDQQNVW